MEQRPPPFPEYRSQWQAPTHEYRVVFWYQSAIDVAGFAPEEVGWSELTVDLVDVEDVHEAIRWAEENLAANEGPNKRDREYVLYARIPDEDRFVQLAGWDPSRHPDGENLRRVG